MTSPARRAAFETVLRVFEARRLRGPRLPGRRGGLDPRDRALAQRLAYGTIQRVRTLDHGIEALGRRPVAKLDPPVRAALRLGAYQLAFSEVAVHAAVNESVELVRARRAGARGRRSRTPSCGGSPSGLRDLVDALPSSTAAQAALRHSYPDWVAETVVARPRPRGGAGADAPPRTSRPRPSSGSIREGPEWSRALPTRRSRARCRSSAWTRGRCARGGSGRRAAARSWPASASAPGGRARARPLRGSRR